MNVLGLLNIPLGCRFGFSKVKAKVSRSYHIMWSIASDV